MYNITPIEGTSTSEKQRLRAVASGPAGPALAGPLFVQETYFLKIEVGQFAHTSRLRVKNFFAHSARKPFYSFWPDHSSSACYGPALAQETFGTVTWDQIGSTTCTT